MEYRESNNNFYSERNGGCTGITHTVQSGDTLYRISKMHNVPISRIMEANPNVDIYNLKIGSKICVPIDTTSMPRESMQEAPRQVVPVMPPTNMNRQQNMDNNRTGNQFRQVNDNLSKLYKNKNTNREQIVCPECPTCPEQRECPTCPPQRPCPPQRECPSCPECPTCPVCKECPPQRECPTCPPQRECPTCPPQRPCPPQRECPVCPECGENIDVIIPIFFSGEQREEEEECKCYPWENRRCTPDKEDYCDDIKVVYPTPFQISEENTWYSKYHQNMGRSGCGCCGHHDEYTAMLDYDYKDYRKNCYRNMFKEADCKK